MYEILYSLAVLFLAASRTFFVQSTPFFLISNKNLFGFFIQISHAKCQVPSAKCHLPSAKCQMLNCQMGTFFQLLGAYVILKEKNNQILLGVG